MFTGIVECVGSVVAVERRGELVHVGIEAPSVREGVSIGDSIAVNGACLTVTALSPSGFEFDAIPETLELTSLAGLEVGARVNLERALRAGARLDGHLVQGHVDACGRVRRLERQGEDVRFYIECDTEFSDQLVPKGSVCIDGVSLTVVGLEDGGFDVALIPHTLKETILGERQPGDPVNLEADVLGKYVKRHLERMLPQD